MRWPSTLQVDDQHVYWKHPLLTRTERKRATWQKRRQRDRTGKGSAWSRECRWLRECLTEKRRIDCAVLCEATAAAVDRIVGRNDAWKRVVNNCCLFLFLFLFLLSSMRNARGKVDDDDGRGLIN
jgi:hypothetical protein